MKAGSEEVEHAMLFFVRMIIDDFDENDDTWQNKVVDKYIEMPDIIEIRFTTEYPISEEYSITMIGGKTATCKHGYLGYRPYFRCFKTAFFNVDQYLRK